VVPEGQITYDVTMNSLPSFHQLLHELIAIPSVSCTQPSLDQPNLPVINRLADWLETLGFSCEIQLIDHYPGKANLIATLGQGNGGLVLAGHTDTVPYDEDLWQHNPLALTEADHKLYGLGTCDMKGFFPIIIECLKQLDLRRVKQPLIILATADEESSMCGARTLVESGHPLARYAVIGEPTGMKPIRMHKGIMMEVLRIQGKSGHSSNPALGANALDAMQAVMGEIIDFRQQLRDQYQNPCFEVAYPTLNLGCIHGGDNPNRICGHCELEFDLRLLPGMDLDQLHQEIYQRVTPIAARFGTELTLTPSFSGIPAFETPANSELVQIVEKLTGQSAEAVNFATEAPFLNQLGMETLVLGPGDIAQAHQPDEYLLLSRIQPTIDLLKQLISRFCL